MIDATNTKLDLIVVGNRLLETIYATNIKLDLIVVENG